MLKNYFKIAFRNMRRNKSYALTNVLGLALGIASAVLIFGLVRYHLSFDAYHSKADRVYRITTEFHGEELSYNTGVTSPLAETFRNDYPIAEKVASVAALSDRVISFPSDKGSPEKFEESVAFAEPDFLNILDLPLLRGDQHQALRVPNTALITERMAKKFFGSADPIGKTFRIDNIFNVTITGVLKNLPVNTDRPEEIYIPFEHLKDHSPWMVEKDWWFSVNRSLQCFVLIKPGVTPARIKAALIAMSNSHYNAKDAKYFQFRAQPLSDIHFNPNLHGPVEKKNLWALSLIGVFLIVTACVNFINLATAQALKRSVEIGIKKVLGVQRWQLFWQFMIETAAITMLAMVFALIFAELALPYVNQLFDVQVKLNLFSDVYMILFLPALLLIMILLSGSYPALVLAGLQPVLALKGKLSQRDAGGLTMRRGLVIGQFGISQLLIIGTLVVAGQIRYSRQADMGFVKDAVVMLPVPNNETAKLNTFRTELSGISGVEDLTFCGDAPASEFSPSTSMRFASRPEAEGFSISLKAGDAHYASMFGLKFLAGRNLAPADSIREFLVNETTVKKLGLAKNQDVIGKTAVINGHSGSIVGVVKDFHNKSFHQGIDAIYITTARDNYSSCAVKLNMSNMNATLSAIKASWVKLYPNNVYKYDFLDERIARFYESDRIILNLIQVFAGIAILIGCLGLYGLVSFMAAQKTREVGVRKVLGASVQSIVWLFGREFTRLLLIAFIIAAPLGWWVMNNWLENFPYRINIGAGIFLSAILVNVVVASATVGYRSLKAALMNPAKSLRSQ
jgi:putative ABC transport system permease protein